MTGCQHLSMHGLSMWIVYLILALLMLDSGLVHSDTEVTGCYKRQYSVNVTGRDGHCWEQVNLIACWGKCPSHEVSL